MMRRTVQGQANLTAIVILVGLIISAVWIWKRLSPETQEFVIDQAIPIAAVVIGIVVLVLAVVKKIRRSAHRERERDYLLAAFQRETVRDKQLELSFALAEVNDYRVNGLEAVAPALKDWVTTLPGAGRQAAPDPGYGGQPPGHFERSDRRAAVAGGAPG